MDQDDNTRELTPGDVKGKGVDLDSTPAGGGDYPIYTKSNLGTDDIMPRLTASARTLANDLMSHHSSSTYLADALPSSKAESSSAQSIASTETCAYRKNTNQGLGDSAFRSARGQENILAEESKFSAFLDGADVLEPIETEDDKRRDYEEDFNHEHPSDQIVNTAAVSAVSAADGLDVAKILDSGYDEVWTEAPENLPAGNERILLRRHLFENGARNRPAYEQRQWEGTLNFFPEFIWGGNSRCGCAELLEHLGTTDPEQARNIWISQWQDILSNYTDEVWGDLGPLVEAAREELHNLSEPSAERAPLQPKALRRLQQILAHIRGF
ncbi:hypothetical protein F4779DRAFT_566084 [Xylariaceae sp. FL0662B]|nr:hypothetical protein F4779DRAFT_566084 [Xylariaceae sp. FL0662B]